MIHKGHKGLTPGNLFLFPFKNKDIIWENIKTILDVYLKMN